MLLFKISHVTFLTLQLVWKFVTADVTVVFVNNQHDIQQRGQDFDKNTQIHSEYTVTRVNELKSVHLKCDLFALLPYLLNICRKFKFLIS